MRTGEDGLRGQVGLVLDYRKNTSAEAPGQAREKQGRNKTIGGLASEAWDIWSCGKVEKD